MRKIISCVLMFIVFLGCKVKMVEAVPPESMQIKVHITTSNGVVEKEEIVNSYDAILLLMKDLGIAHDYVILYNGNILNPYFSFDYYGIKENDTIFFMEKEETKSIIYPKSKETMDYELKQELKHYRKELLYRKGDLRGVNKVKRVRRQTESYIRDLIENTNLDYVPAIGETPLLLEGEVYLPRPCSSE